MSHHLHIDPVEGGGNRIHCLRCQVETTDGTIPPEPCPKPDVTVACDAVDLGIVIVGDES